MNRVTIDVEKTGDLYDLKIQDNYATGTEFFDSNPDPDMDDLGLLAWALQNSEDGDSWSVLDGVRDNESDVVIQGNPYTWDQIKHLFPPPESAIPDYIPPRGC